MTTLIVCLIIAVLLPYLVKLPLGYAMARTKGGYNNSYPREQQAALQGFGARSFGAHQNSFEALIIFSTALLTAIATNHVTQSIEYLAIAFIVLRIIYTGCYLMDFARMRSTVWFLGFLSCLIILFKCLP